MGFATFVMYSETIFTMPSLLVRRVFVGALVALILSVFCVTSVADGLQVTLAELDGYGVKASKISVSLPFDADGNPQLSVSAESFSLKQQGLRFEDVRMLCTALMFGDDLLRCDEGSISFRYLGSANKLRLRFDHRADGTDLQLGPSTFLGGRLAVTAAQSRRVLDLKASFEVADVTAIAPLVGLLGWSESLLLGGGSAHLSITLAGKDGDFSVELEDLKWSDESGLRAAEELAVVVQGTFSLEPSGWLFKLFAELTEGAIVHDSLFVEASVPAQRLELEGRWVRATNVVELERASVSHPGVFEVSGRGRFALTPLHVEQFSAHLSRSAVKTVYETYLQPLAWGTVLEDVELDGELELHGNWSSVGGGHVNATIHQLNVEDNSGRFALYGVDAELHWDAVTRPRPTSVRWEGGSVYSIDVGASHLEGSFQGDRFELTDNLSVPILDGSLEVNRFDISRIGSDALQWTTSAAVMPITLETLTRALGWPAFSGTLAGGIPEVSFSEGTITANGSLVVSVFDGDVLIRDLSIDDVFGLVPALRANIDVWGLSLEPLTRAFSFGDIQGRLDGHVHDLVLENWQPVAFDAEFATPPNDDTRHRISQNAVDSLAQLGGGAVALSSTFLRFFETFAYDRLGVRCHLTNGICEMGGVLADDEGYYIVKGGGFPPRIDVRGFNQRVAWNTLLERLIDVTRSDGPIIQ